MVGTLQLDQFLLNSRWPRRWPVASTRLLTPAAGLAVGKHVKLIKRTSFAVRLPPLAKPRP